MILHTDIGQNLQTDIADFAGECQSSCTLTSQVPLLDPSGLKLRVKDRIPTEPVIPGVPLSRRNRCNSPEMIAKVLDPAADSLQFTSAVPMLATGKPDQLVLSAIREPALRALNHAGNRE